MKVTLSTKEINLDITAHKLNFKTVGSLVAERINEKRHNKESQSCKIDKKDHFDIKLIFKNTSLTDKGEIKITDNAKQIFTGIPFEHIQQILNATDTLKEEGTLKIFNTNSRKLKVGSFTLEQSPGKNNFSIGQKLS